MQPKAMLTQLEAELQAAEKEAAMPTAEELTAKLEAELQTAVQTTEELEAALSAELEAELQAMPTAEELMAELEAELQTVVLLTTAHGGDARGGADGGAESRAVRGDADC